MQYMVYLFSCYKALFIKKIGGKESLGVEEGQSNSGLNIF